MGKRGPRRTPAEIKIARGTYRADKQGDPANMPQYEHIGKKRPPRSLGKAGAARWKAAVPLMAEARVLTEADLQAVENYCRAFDEVAACDRVLAEEGEYHTTESGRTFPHPAINTRFNWLRMIAKYEQEFGLTPSARGGIQTTTPAKAPAITPRRRVQ